MIVGTNAYCKLTKISISENIATISLLIFATQSTVPPKSFRLCVKDTDTGKLSYIDNNTYWIDQVNNYSYEANNVDTNKHKEIMFSLDISRANTSDIQNNRWIRNCYIYLVDSSKHIESVPAWSSDLLNLVSDDFEVPDIKSISFETSELGTFYLDQNDLTQTELRGKIKAKFNLSYESEKDFNYNNNNFTALLRIRSITTDTIFEEKEIPTSSVSLYNEIETSNYYTVNTHYVVQLVINNKNGQTIREYRKIYKPVKKYSNTFIKTEDGIKRVVASFMNTTSKVEHEGDWIGESDMNVIKVNYNNACVKMPKKILPYFFCYRQEVHNDNGTITKKLFIQIDDKLSSEPLYTNYHFEVYLNNNLVTYLDRNSSKLVMIANDDSFSDKYINVLIKGYYYNNNGNRYEFNKYTIVIPTAPVCANELLCSENIYVNDIVDGYLHDNKLYESRTLVNNEYVYSNEIESRDIGLYYDLITKKVYKWNSTDEEFIIL